MAHDSGDNISQFPRPERDFSHEDLSDTELASQYLSLWAHPSVVQAPVDHIVEAVSRDPFLTKDPQQRFLHERLQVLLASPEPKLTLSSMRNNNAFHDQFEATREQLITEKQRQALDTIEQLHLLSIAHGQPADTHLKVIITGILNDPGTPDESPTA